MKRTTLRMLIALMICISLLISILPQSVYATEYTYTDENGKTYTFYFDDNGWGWSAYWTDFSTTGTGSSGAGGSDPWQNGFDYKYEKASDIEKIIAICQKYDDRTVTTGVRNQINWMNQLYGAVVQNFIGQLSLGDTLLISLLNHTEINTTLLASSYSIGDINREIAQKIAEGTEGYIDMNAIAKATGLKDEDVRSILEGIADGVITPKKIAVGKNQSSSTNRGPYMIQQALKQEKVWEFLEKEIERMISDPTTLEVLYNDLGAGYVGNMLSGQQLDKYKVSLYKKYLAKTLDNVLESKYPYSVSTFYLSETEPYKVSKKTRSLLSQIFSHEIGAEEDALSQEARDFLDKHLKNGKLSEAEAREFLIITEEYEKGEHGIGEAAKQLVNGYKHLKGFKKILDTTGDVMKIIDQVKKAEDLIEYWATDYAEQEVLLDYLVDSLSDSGADMDMLVAARELQQEYEDKLSSTLDKVYDALVDEGISTIKSQFPPLGIAETAISLAGIITGADKQVDALETGFAMQGICQQALTDYENAVIAVNEGDTSEEAISCVLTTFETARQSLISYYKAMVELSKTDAEKNTYIAEMKRLENAEFGYVTMSLPFGFTGGGSR